MLVASMEYLDSFLLDPWIYVLMQTYVCQKASSALRVFEYDYNKFYANTKHKKSYILSKI